GEPASGVPRMSFYEVLTIVKEKLDTRKVDFYDDRSISQHIYRRQVMAKFDLKGRKALVTGGARGIGAGIAEALAVAGASVMIGDVLADLGRETARRLSASGAKVGFFPLDVTKDGDWAAAAE